MRHNWTTAGRMTVRWPLKGNYSCCEDPSRKKCQTERLGKSSSSAYKLHDSFEIERGGRRGAKQTGGEIRAKTEQRADYLEHLVPLCTPRHIAEDMAERVIGHLLACICAQQCTAHQHHTGRPLSTAACDRPDHVASGPALADLRAQSRQTQGEARGIDRDPARRAPVSNGEVSWGKGSASGEASASDFMQSHKVVSGTRDKYRFWSSMPMLS